jgi:hypothetical protein
VQDATYLFLIRKSPRRFVRAEAKWVLQTGVRTATDGGAGVAPSARRREAADLVAGFVLPQQSHLNRMHRGTGGASEADGQFVTGGYRIE